MAAPSPSGASLSPVPALPGSSQDLAEENRLLRDEVNTARRAAEITASLVVRQFEEMERVQRDLEQQNQYMAALHRTALGILSRREPESLVEDLVRRACRLGNAPNGFICVVVPAQSGDAPSELHY